MSDRDAFNIAADVESGQVPSMEDVRERIEQAARELQYFGSQINDE